MFIHDLSSRKKKCVAIILIIIMLVGFIIFGIGCSTNMNNPVCYAGACIMFLVIILICFVGCLFKASIIMNPPSQEQLLP